MKYLSVIGLAALFGVFADCHGATIEIVRIRDDKATFVSETGETYFSVTADVNVLAANHYSFLLELSRVDAHSRTNLSVGRHTLILPCYSRNILSRLDGPVSNVTITVCSPPSTGPASTFQCNKSQALSRVYAPHEFKRQAARVVDTTQSHEAIAATLAEITLLTQHRLRDKKYGHTVQLVEPRELFGRSCDTTSYRLFRSQLPGHETTLFIAVLETKKEAFIVEDLETFNQYSSTLTPAPAGASQYIAQAKAFMAVGQLAANPTVLTEIPESKRVRPDRPKDMSVSQWFEENNTLNQFHVPELEETKEARTVRFFSWQGLVGIIRYHEYSLKPNGEILSHKDDKLATWVGDWWIH
jgi:hypothetical protein